jgi:hypothetical protein
LILVISHPGDSHAVAVLGALARAGHPAVMVDTAQFPAQGALTQRFGEGAPRLEITLDGTEVDVTTCGAAWWRRPQPFTLHDGIDPDVASFAYTECHEAVAGMWAALSATWVNAPELDELAHHKPYQLAVATEVGLDIPRTLITNDPDQARAFADELGPSRTIYKTFLATTENWRETRLLREEEVDLLDSVRLAPVIFQEFVAAVADIRVTVVGERMFATAITPAPGGYEVDYRMDLTGARFVPTELPGEVEAGLRRLMARLGIVYGAIDLRRAESGAHTFLEVNPAGEWQFVEERTAQPITTAVAELLMELDR